MQPKVQPNCTIFIFGNSAYVRNLTPGIFRSSVENHGNLGIMKLSERLTHVSLPSHKIIAFFVACTENIDELKQA